MMMKVLNKFLGRALIDPTFFASLENGEIENLLEEYEFCSEIRIALQKIKANDFLDFANKAYSIVCQHDSKGPDVPFSWPTDGLLKQADEEEQTKAA